MKEQLQKIYDLAKADLEKVQSIADIEDFKLKYLSRKGELNSIKKNLKDLSDEDKRVVGAFANEVANNLEASAKEKYDFFYKKELDEKLKQEKIDVTLSGKYVQMGHVHPITETINEIADNIQNIDLKQYINPEKITGYIKSVIGVASGIFDIFVAIIVSVYILLQRGQIMRFFRRLSTAIFDEKICNKIEEYINSTNNIFYKFISGQLIDAVVVGIMVTIAMSIIGVKYAVLLGFLIGLFNIIPYFGAIIAVGISILITVITGGLSQAIIMAIVVIVLQQIDSNIINPKIIGDSLEISPLIVIFAVTIGGAYFGVLGMFLAVPVAAVLKIVINDWVNYKNENKYV